MNLSICKNQKIEIPSGLRKKKNLRFGLKDRRNLGLKMSFEVCEIRRERR